MQQTKVLTLVAAPGHPVLDDMVCAKLHALMLGAGARIVSQDWLNPRFALDIVLETRNAGRLRKDLAPDLAALQLDHALQAPEGRRKRLLVADMESTIIGQEMLDVLAARAGLGDRIAAITARAMRGELNFEGSLKERVAMLAGLPLSLLEDVAAQMTLNRGAKVLVQTMRQNGAYCALVTGGFANFAEPIRALSGFHEAVANRLSTDGERLTGKVEAPIIGPAGKKTTLTRLLRERNLKASDALAVGDGANDIDMIKKAGLGVGYRPKDVLRKAADACLERADLSALLYFQGYSLDEFRS